MVMNRPGRKPVIIITGQSGIGKTVFLRYLAIRLAQQQIPFLWVSPNDQSMTLFCQQGCYPVAMDQGSVNIIQMDGAKDLYILCDSNNSREIPFIRATKHMFLPRLVYATSPKLEDNEKLLRQSIDNQYQQFVMMPWTLFEMELM